MQDTPRVKWISAFFAWQLQVENTSENSMNFRSNLFFFFLTSVVNYWGCEKGYFNTVRRGYSMYRLSAWIFRKTYLAERTPTTDWRRRRCIVSPTKKLRGDAGSLMAYGPELFPLLHWALPRRALQAGSKRAASMPGLAAVLCAEGAQRPYLLINFS